MTDLIFSTPWWLPTTIVIVGLALLVAGNNRQEAKLRNAGLATLVTAVVLVLVSYLVETDKEKAERLTGELTQAVADHNWPKVADLLDPKASLYAADVQVLPDRKGIVDEAKADCERYGLRSIGKHVSDVRQDPDRSIFVDLSAFATFDQAGTVPTTWRFEWQPSADGSWHVHALRCLSIAGKGDTATIRQLLRQ